MEKRGLKVISEIIRKEGLRRGLRQQTIKTYISVLDKFFRTYKKAPHEVTKKDIEKHLLRLLENNKSGNTVNVHLNALKFLYEKVLKKKLTVNIHFTKTRKSLPTFLTQEEIIHFFDCIKNRKHKLMITLLYSAGLRVSELVNLKVKDLQMNNSYGMVKNGKGGKDRFFIIAEKLVEELGDWILRNKFGPENYLFTGYGNSRYSTQSVRAIIKNASRKAGFSKNVHPHTLRHSFATHLIENGYSVMELQPLLGHSKLETTMIYTHLASPKLMNIKSPLDKLKIW